MSKDGLNPIGKMEAKLKHLEFIQGVVNRLAADSFRAADGTVMVLWRRRHRHAVQPPSDSKPNRYSKRGDVSSSAWSTVKMGCSPFRSSVHWRCNRTYSHNLRLQPLRCFHLVKFDATAIRLPHLGRFPTCRH